MKEFFSLTREKFCSNWGEKKKMPKSGHLVMVILVIFIFGLLSSMWNKILINNIIYNIIN